MNTEKTIAITDFGLATALETSGVSALRIEKLSEKRSAFVYEGSDKTRELIEQYWSGELLVPAQQYHQQGKMLKSRLFGAVQL